MRKKFLELRDFLKAHFDKLDTTPQKEGEEKPFLQKPYDEDGKFIELPEVDESICKDNNFFNVIKKRRSKRNFDDTKLTLKELSYLLWATQGVHKVFGNNVASFRTVPSAGARHPFETYLYVRLVEGLDEGIYRYLPFENKLIFEYTEENLKEKIIQATYDQKFAGECAVNFIWSVIPNRAEWRYGITSHKCMAIDAGHISQNLYLAAESLNLATCAMAKYYQNEMNNIIKADGVDEFVIYMSPVGKAV